MENDVSQKGDKPKATISIRKMEMAVILVTVAFMGVICGYILSSIPNDGTFEISVGKMAVLPSVQASSYHETVETSNPASQNQEQPISTEIILIDINTATLEELQKLPGVGPAIAKRIIDERENGSFLSVDDLTRVKGIGEKTVEKIKPYATV